MSVVFDYQYATYANIILVFAFLCMYFRNFLLYYIKSNLPIYQLVIIHLKVYQRLTLQLPDELDTDLDLPF